MSTRHYINKNLIKYIITPSQTAYPEATGYLNVCKVYLLHRDYFLIFICSDKGTIYTFISNKQGTGETKGHVALNTLHKKPCYHENQQKQLVKQCIKYLCTKH